MPRDRFTAGGFYHNERAQFGIKALIMEGVFLFVLVKLLNISRWT
jgi:hypothetical protein